MNMQVKYRLATVDAVVNVESVTIVFDALRPSNFCGYPHQMPQQGSLFCRRIGNGSNGLFWDDQHVDRRLGVDVAKGQRTIVFINDISGDVSIDDLLKYSHTASLRERLTPPD